MAKLGALKDVQSHTGTQDSSSVTLTVKDKPIGDIHIQTNVRMDYTEISELSESIKQYGLLQPITVYEEDGRLVVKTGHRRFMAYKKLYEEDHEKYHSIRCIISDAQNIPLIQLIENVQRVDLSQYDLYQALNQLKKQGMTLRKIAEVIGKTEVYIKDLFVGVNELNRDPDLQNLIGSAGTTISDIKETKPIKDKKKRIELLEKRKSGEITRAEMRKKVKELTSPEPAKDSHHQLFDNDTPTKTAIDYERLFEIWTGFSDEESEQAVTRLIEEHGLGPMDGMSFSGFCNGYEMATNNEERGR
jgi:ParB family chromosome partitioning protein